MRFLMTEKTVRAAIEALEFKAYMLAGQSQDPDLFTKEETEEWETSIKMREALRITLKREAQSKRSQRQADTPNLFI